MGMMDFLSLSLFVLFLMSDVCVSLRGDRGASGVRRFRRATDIDSSSDVASSLNGSNTVKTRRPRGSRGSRRSRGTRGSRKPRTSTKDSSINISSAIVSSHESLTTGNPPIDEHSTLVPSESPFIATTFPGMDAEIFTHNVIEPASGKNRELFPNVSTYTENPNSPTDNLNYPNRSPQNLNYPNQQKYYLDQKNDPPQQKNYPTQQQNYPPQQKYYPPQQQNYPPQQQNYPPQQKTYPTQQQNYPPQQKYYPPQQQNYPPQQQKYPPQKQNYVPNYRPQQQYIANPDGFNSYRGSYSRGRGGGQTIIQSRYQSANLAANIWRPSGSGLFANVTRRLFDNRKPYLTQSQQGTLNPRESERHKFFAWKAQGSMGTWKSYTGQQRYFSKTGPGGNLLDDVEDRYKNMRKDKFGKIKKTRGGVRHHKGSYEVRTSEAIDEAMVKSESASGENFRGRGVRGRGFRGRYEFNTRPSKEAKDIDNYPTDYFDFVRKSFRDEDGVVRYPYRIGENLQYNASRPPWDDDEEWRNEILSKLPDPPSVNMKTYLDLDRPLTETEALYRDMTQRPGYVLRRGKSLLRLHQLWHWYRKGKMWNNLHNYFFKPVEGYKFTKTVYLTSKQTTPKYEDQTEIPYFNPWTQQKKIPGKKQRRMFNPVDWNRIKHELAGEYIRSTLKLKWKPAVYVTKGNRGGIRRGGHAIRRPQRPRGKVVQKNPKK